MVTWLHGYRETNPRNVNAPGASEPGWNPVERVPAGFQGRPALRAAKPDSRRGFSLIEFIGVLAVIAVLAAALVPAVIKRVDFTAWSSETASLAAMADALKLYIVRSNAIPDQTQWSTAIGSQLGLSPNEITTTPRNYSRAFLIDTSGWLGTAPFSSGYWTQSPIGTTFTSGARLMIVSTVAGPPLPVTSGKPGYAAFTNIWNTPLRASPWPTTTWNGRGEDLVTRINLDPMFCRVILNPIDMNHFGSFAIENNGTVSSINAVTSVPSDSWYLQGTVLRLYDNNTGPANLEIKAVLQDRLQLCL